MSLPSSFQSLQDTYINFYKKKGIKYYSKDLNKAIKEMENQNLIEVYRKPSFTPTGRKVTSLDYKKYLIYIRKKK